MKYTNARYPDKINDLMDNNGNINPEIIPPAPSGGTKLYKHTLTDNTGYNIVLITDYATAFDFSILNTHLKFSQFLKTINVINFYSNTDADAILQIIFDIHDRQLFGVLEVDENSMVYFNDFRDWHLNDTIDTVTAL